MSGCNLIAPSPCAKINCGLYGHCINGICECDIKYTGPNCRQQKTPIKIKLSDLKITSFSAIDKDGIAYDMFDNPDLSVAIYKDSKLIGRTEVLKNANPLKIHKFSKFLEITDVDARYSIWLEDYDPILGNYVKMKGYTSHLYNSNNMFPNDFEFNEADFALSGNMEYRFGESR